MANRLIGVEIVPGAVRVAVLGQHRGTTTVMALEQRPWADSGELPGLLASLVPGGFQLADLVGTALPAGEGYVRPLTFPFRERRKILAAAPFELASRLPVAIEDCQLALLAPRDDAGGARVVVAAVPKTTIAPLLQPFDQNRTPLQVLDLMPHALAGGIGDAVGNAILVCLNEQEAVVTGFSAGQVDDYRLFPLDGDLLAPETILQLCREITACQQRSSGGHLPVLVAGALATPQLLEQLRTGGVAAELFSLPLGHRNIPPAFIPAVALALRAGNQGSERSFNLRHGSYAYRGEATALKKYLYGLAGLLGVSLLLFALATGLDYRDKKRQADLLLQQMTRQYSETFPGSTLTVDVTLQMQSKLQELRNRATALGIDSQPQSLAILRELSAVTARTPFEVEELFCDAGACSVTGSTASFDAVNLIKEQLGSSALFGKVEVSETRKAVDGTSIEFRLRLPLAAGKEGQ